MFGFFRRPPEVPPEPEGLEGRWQGLPSVLGPRLRLLRPLGENNGWTEWLAVDAARQQVVVTVWPEWMESNPEGRKRMRREAAACSQLRHPNIVPILGYAEQGEWFWWIRPWQKGRRLSQLLGQPLEQAVSWLRQLTEVLACAHGLGIVHQRLHPDCIWVHEDRVQVSDFAFAQLETRITHAGPYHLPTPRFLAPEQITGMSLTPASNYFTLGSLAFELLSGRPLFDGDEVLQVIFRLLQEDLPSFEHLPAPLPELLTRLLERDSTRRLSDPKEVLGYLGSSPTGQEMREVLADLQGEGQAVSQNEVFTLDPGRALEKLSQFRFPDTWEWLVSLCAAAAALGAEKLALDWKADRLSLVYQGVRLSLEDFWLSAYGAHQGGSGYLARGLASALTQHGGTLEIASAGWKLRTDRVQKERLGRALVNHLQVRLEGCPEPDWEQVRRRLLFTALPISWCGKWQSTVVANRPAPLEAFSLRVDPLETSQWLAVVDGMTFPLERLLPEAGQVVVWGPLRLDADRRALLQDDQLERVLPLVQAGVEKALEDFALAPGGLDVRSMKLYRRAFALWESGGERGKLDRFCLAFLRLQSGDEPPSKLAEQCFVRAATWEAPPEVFWHLACRSRWFPLLQADWATAVVVSERGFAKEHARLHWLLQAWLERGQIFPNLQELGSLLHRFPDQRLDARFDPLLVAQLPVNPPPVWLQLIPWHWTQTRLFFMRKEGEESPE